MNMLSMTCLALCSSLLLALAPQDDTADLAGATPAGEEAAPEQEDTGGWDVQNPGIPTREIALDTRTGTWLGLDVSPDGSELVFDLLGDLYRMPIEGGAADPITSGLAWDMQPRYSPDGQTIAFTSDRGGGDNIWIIAKDGSDARAVTHESFRLLNSPVWTPDGEYIAARKHFTSFRSLGAGEIWLYHKSGGDGLPMVDKPNMEKDVGEPAFSPDGRYLYYSYDRTPGPTFEYSKDPAAEIYAIQRLDRESGEIETFISGTGGSIRPTPSPDGKLIAFIRRVRLKTVLYLHEIETGREWALWDGLERDLQETWGIHGVYPNIAWLPDQSAIIVWAQGGFWRIATENGAAQAIPFHVEDTRQVCEPVRRALDIDEEAPTNGGDPISAVAPETFKVRMLRWAAPSPDGKEIVFGALGRLWLQEVPDGDLRALTSDEGHFEYFPAWSRDGSAIVFTSWDDEQLGAVRIVPRAGGASRVVTQKPGHYAEPCFAPDGQTIVFKRTRGRGLMAPLYSRSGGLWAMDLDGGNERRISKSGQMPHFGADDERVFFMDWAGGDRRVLKSITLGGHDVRTHLGSEAATEFRVSPDGRWVAFAERYKAYITPFPPTGRKVDVAPGSAAMPQAGVSVGSADFLRWSTDSERLHWTMGPQVYTRELRETFAFLAGAPEELPDPPAIGLDLGFRAWTDIPEGRIAFVGAKLISMRGYEVLEDQIVIVEGDRITAVGHAGEVDIPADTFLVDARGKVLMPGLIDVHAHGPQGASGMQPEQNWLHYSMLSFGVTTVHDPSNNTQEIFASSELAKSGQITAPRIYSTGTILYGAKGSYKAQVDSYDDARFHLERMKAVGAFSVKSYNQPRRDQRQMIIKAAHDVGILVLPEGGSLFQHNMTHVVDGHTGVEHSIPVPRVYDDVKQLWGATPVGYTPTLGVAYGGVWGENYWYQHTRVFENERLAAFVPRERIDRRSLRNVMHVKDDDWNHIRAARVAKDLFDAGVEVHVGAHGQREGLAVHWELWMLVQGGMTPHEALLCGTLNGARYLGLDAELGSVEVGKIADLILLDADPLSDIRASENVQYTMIGGHLYDAATMQGVGPGARTREPFWFE